MTRGRCCNDGDFAPFLQELLPSPGANYTARGVHVSRSRVADPGGVDVSRTSVADPDDFC
jgi:hypothetical protein